MIILLNGILFPASFALDGNLHKRGLSACATLTKFNEQNDKVTNKHHLRNTKNQMNGC